MITEGKVSKFGKFHRKAPVPKSFLMKLLDGGLQPVTLLKRRLRHRWKFAKFRGTPFLQNSCGQLLLDISEY